MVKSKKLQWKVIRLEKQYRLCGESQKERIHEELMEAIAELNNVINWKPRKRYNFKVRSIFKYAYDIYWKAFGSTFKHGGVRNLIGKVQKAGNCIYPNTPYYRITKCWKFL